MKDSITGKGNVSRSADISPEGFFMEDVIFNLQPSLPPEYMDAWPLWGSASPRALNVSLQRGYVEASS